MRVRVLGQLTVSDDDGRVITAAGLPPRARHVLGVLTAHHDQLLSKDSLADAIWGDRLPDKYGAALEHYISVLRRRLEPGRPRAESCIVTRAGGYLFSTDRATLDLAEVHGLVARADARPAGAPERIALRQRVIDSAPTLPFAEDEYAAWAARPRAEVRDAILTAHLEVGSAVETQDPEHALRLARRAIDLDRYSERPYQIAMRAAAALGRPDEALRWFGQCSQRLREELGVGPSAATQQLRDRIATERVTARPPLTVVDHAATDQRQPTSPVPTSPVPTSPVPTSPVPTSPVPTSPVPSTLSPTLALAVAAPTGQAERARPMVATPARRSRRDTRKGPEDLLRHLALQSPGNGRRTTRDAQPGPDLGPGIGVGPGTALGPGTAMGPGTALGPGLSAGSLPPAGWGTRYDSGPLEFIGRREEIELILASPPVPLIHVAGPPGAGKSALLAEVRRRAPERVALGAAVGAGALRLSWLHDLVTQLGVGGPPAHAVRRAMAAGRPLLREELAELADAFSERGPLVLGIDDAALLDEQSAADLAWLVRSGRGICLALAVRPEAQLAELPIARLHGAAVLHLRRLTHADFRGTRDPDAAESSGGIPALLAVLHQPRRVAVATAVHIVGLRTRGLPEAAGRILRACAALGSLRVDQLATLTDLPLPEVLRCTDQLLQAELIDEGPGGHVRHSSELVRAALAEQVSSAHTMYLRQRLKAVASA